MRLLMIVSVLYLVIFAFNLLVFAFWTGTYVQTYPTDGTFQLYNPMRRILMGQTPGLDFPFFHGLGVPLLHFPFFIALGENLFAAETTKWLVSPLLFFITSIVFFYAFFRNIKKTIIGTAIAVGVASILMFISFYPSNSLLGIRTTFPILVGAAMLWQTSKKLRIPKFPAIPLNIFVATILLGASFVCGSEQGLAAILAFSIVQGYRHWQNFGISKTAFIRLMYEVGLAVLFSLLFLLAITKGHILPALQYALIDVPGDQGWYFGAPPNTFLSANGIARALFQQEMLVIAIITILGTTPSYFAVKHKMFKQVHPAIFFFLFYGAIVFLASSTGYFLPAAHLVPLQRGALLFGVAFFVAWLFKDHHIPAKLPKARKAAVLLPIISIVAVTLYVGLQLIQSVQRTTELKPLDVARKSRVAQHENDRYPLSAEWGKSVDEVLSHIPEGADIWSTYTGVYDSIRGQVNPSEGGEDYIIHALGDKRRAAYSNQFSQQKPEYVITIRPGFFVYEEWLWSSNWDFYRQIFAHYEVVSMTDMHVLWKYRESESFVDSYTQASKSTKPISTTWKLPDNKTTQPKLYEVKVNYTASAGLKIAALNRLPRYLITAVNNGVTYCPVSLPSDKTTWTFPVILAPNVKHVVLLGSDRGVIPTSKLNIKSVEYREITIPQRTGESLLDNTSKIELGATTQPTCGQ